MTKIPISAAGNNIQISVSIYIFDRGRAACEYIAQPPLRRAVELSTIITKYSHHPRLLKNDLHLVVAVEINRKRGAVNGLFRWAFTPRGHDRLASK